MEWLIELFEKTKNGLVWGVGGIGFFFFMLIILKSMIRVTFPNFLLVVTGRKKKHEGKKFGFTVERGRTTKIPYLQTISQMDLGIYPINVRVEGVNSANGITLGADATACVCIDDDDEAMLYTAVERLMGKARREIHEQIQQTLVGNFRGALNKATPLQAIGMEESLDGDIDGHTDIEKGERAQFRQELLDDINSDVSSFGMKVVSVSFQKIWDTSNYIANLAQKNIAEKRQQVEIEEARLKAIAEQAESDADRRISIAKSQAEEKIIQAREKLETYRRESLGAIEKVKLEADNAIVEAFNKGRLKIEEQNVELQILENKSQTLKAEAENKTSEILAEGEKEAVRIREDAYNKILKQKVEMLMNSGIEGKTVLFIQQQIAELFKAFKEQAQNIKVDSLVVMNDQGGFNDAVNRGPAAFVDFLIQFEKALGIKISDFITNKKDEK